MKPCPICNRKFKNDGLRIHLSKIHGIKTPYDSDSNPLASESNKASPKTQPRRDSPKTWIAPPIPSPAPTPSTCPVPGCNEEVEADDLIRHLEFAHEDWRLSSGKWVFDV